MQTLAAPENEAMTVKAAIDAQCVDYSNDPRHKGFIRVILHVPEERGGLLAAVLGWATYTNPIPVALARLDSRKEDHQAMPPAPASPNLTRGHVAPEKRLVQRAAILCNDPLFQRYMNEHAPIGCGPVTDEETAANAVRQYCRVDSRSKIVLDTPAGTRWNLLESAFIAWRDADKFVEAT